MEVREGPVTIHIVRHALARGWCLFDFFQTNQPRPGPPLTANIARRHVVRHPKRPRFEGTAAIIRRQTTPELQVNLLAQVSPLIRVKLITRCETVKSGADFTDYGGIELIAPRERRTSCPLIPHTCIVAGRHCFLTGIPADT